MAPRTTIPQGRLRRDQPLRKPQGCIALLQQAWDNRAMDQGGEVCPELDQALLPLVCREPGTVAAIRPNLQLGPLPAQAMFTQTNQ